MGDVAYVCSGVVVGVGIGLWWSRSWVARFRYEAEHWNSAIKQHKDLYANEHTLVKSLRAELIEMHHRITKLTVREVEVLEWVSRNVKRAKEENDKLLQPSTPPLRDVEPPSEPSGT